jgi:hypothetical protein
MDHETTQKSKAIMAAIVLSMGIPHDPSMELRALAILRE